jgi:hexokinase
LVEEIKKLEEQFTIPTAKLKAITEHFVSELAKGITHRSVAHNLMLIFYKA